MATGPWYVIVTAPGAHGVPGVNTVSQMPFPAGATEVAGPFNTKAEALANANQDNNPVSQAKNAVGDVASKISSSILGPLFQSNIWLRVAEVLIGVVLIGIGLNAMLKGKPLQVITNTAGLAAKVVP